VRRVYFVLAGLLLLAVVAQFYLAAVGGFDKPRTEDSFAIHRMIGMTVPLLSILATGAAALVRAPGRLIGLTILPAGLGIVQILLATVADAPTTRARRRASSCSACTGSTGSPS
jgi:hypothetical protein